MTGEIIPDEYVDKTCKIGQGAACCRYLVMGHKGFECMKGVHSVALTIDQRIIAGTYHSLGDNCQGWPLDNTTHHLVPVKFVLICRYCFRSDVTSQEVCLARCRVEGVL